jgi:hypothetical protein
MTGPERRFRSNLDRTYPHGANIFHDPVFILKYFSVLLLTYLFLLLLLIQIHLLSPLLLLGHEADPLCGRGRAVPPTPRLGGRHRRLYRRLSLVSCIYPVDEIGDSHSETGGPARLPA